MSKRTRIHIKALSWRLVRYVMVPLLVLLSVRVAWGMAAGHQLSRARETMRAKGITPTVEELPDPASIRDAENGAMILRRVVDAFYRAEDLEEESWLARSNFRSLSSRHLAALKTAWHNNPQLVEILDELQDVRLNIPPRHADPYTVSSASRRDGLRGTSRGLCSLLCQLSLIAAQDGDATAALRHLRRVYWIARALEGRPDILGVLTADTCRRDAADFLEHLEPKLPWSDPAVRREAEALLADMAPEGVVLTRSAEGEVLYLHGMVNEQRRRAQWWLAPLWDQDEARALARFAENYPWMQSKTYPETSAHPFQFPPEVRDRLGELAFEFSSRSVDYPAHATMAFATQSQLQGTQILIAARLFQADKGRLPQGVDELVPEYLKNAPADVFSPTGSPLRYRIDPTGPTVWSVGQNGLDEDALLALPPDARTHQRDVVMGAAWRAFRPF